MENSTPLLVQQLDALLANEKNSIANLANASALLMDTLLDINWAGFYLFDKNANELILGPFQGKVACMHIALNSGVVGKAYATKQTIIVPDVHAFPGHIACDSASNAEIVIPIVVNNQYYGVLDIDSPSLDRFSEQDAKTLEIFVTTLASHLAESR
ncbi:GAF domain-containing protein [Weissella beninensis]|uniref:GAF domain-containing protein n=1 Tax=Periweissella beninensis TaxID=504936 RepID=A0ABT0VI99_9LACO|nr:GAF domain-containing protein [Periweissella beninensis]MBM7543650.1 GAF domain-containing protein [Periweissella beninensis]MCM2436629.1 GAF domain-containing protein [Periweissella beninensis]